MTDASVKILGTISSYLRTHGDLALHWQRADQEPGGELGYWEIIFVLDCMKFEGDAMSSKTLDVLANKLPK